MYRIADLKCLNYALTNIGNLYDIYNIFMKGFQKC